MTTDLLLEGRHFLSDVDPEALGHKALAVNVSDLAAMGATPLGCVLGLSLPSVDDIWLGRFAHGFRALADAVACPLVGGDTTRSQQGIVISVTAMGQVPEGRALTRSAARSGDDIWVTGTLGGAHIALELLQGKHPSEKVLLDTLLPLLERPQPPVHFGAALVGLAHAAIDISDGLLQDLGHVLTASGCAAELDYAVMPVHPALKNLDPVVTQSAVLNGGDVYQLCFTAAPEDAGLIRQLAERHHVAATIVGRVLPGEGLRVLKTPAPLGENDYTGFDHFR